MPPLCGDADHVPVHGVGWMAWRVDATPSVRSPLGAEQAATIMERRLPRTRRPHFCRDGEPAARRTEAAAFIDPYSNKLCLTARGRWWSLPSSRRPRLVGAPGVACLKADAYAALEILRGGCRCPGHHHRLR